MTIKIVISDDHEVVRLGLKSLLQEIEQLEVVGEAKDGMETIEMVSEMKPDMVLMDIRMPKMNGIEACKEIKRNYPNTKVIILTSYSTDEEIRKAILVGADAYLMKETGSNNLVNTIFEVYSGRYVLDHEITRKVIEHVRKIESNLDEEILTPQEFQILALVAKGMTNREIAKTINLTEKTIRNYVSIMLNKLGLKNRTEATSYAIRNKLV
ncbi:MAG: hypothetical protein APF76_09865 [Desulfitibacter sp. BRH_c19]|nr:MAG: hypothetical protein APF76_09865 [Desulfitibacter sp. BRH_c19]